MDALHKADAVGVLLTGMGKDGALGLKNIRNAGGTTFAQDEDSCIVFGMPKKAIEIDAADKVLSLSQISESLMEFNSNIIEAPIYGKP